MTKFSWRLKYMANYILEVFFLTTSPSTQTKCPKIYAATPVLPLKAVKKYAEFNETQNEDSRSNRWNPGHILALKLDNIDSTESNSKRFKIILWRYWREIKEMYSTLRNTKKICNNYVTETKGK